MLPYGFTLKTYPIPERGTYERTEHLRYHGVGSCPLHPAGSPRRSDSLHHPLPGTRNRNTTEETPQPHQRISLGNPHAYHVRCCNLPRIESMRE